MPRTEHVGTLDETELLERMTLVAEAFRPSAPIDRRALFSGRTDQIAELFSVVQQPGAHAVVFGERGVGKTSLAEVSAERLASRRSARGAARPATRGDDFSSMWRKALRRDQVARSGPASASRRRARSQGCRREAARDGA